MWQVTIPDFILPSVNKLLNSEKWLRTRIKRDAAFVIQSYCWMAKVTAAHGKRRVSFLVELENMRRAPDPDNCWKILLDSLVSGKMLLDDRAKYVELGSAIVRRGPATQSTIFIEDLSSGDQKSCGK